MSRSETRSAVPEVAGPLVEASDVTFGYGAAPVIEHVDLSVGRGEFVALVGPNGSGKSTLLKLLLGVVKPDAGRILLLGRPPGEVVDRWRIGYVPQRPVLAPDVPATAREVVTAGRLARRGWWRPLRPGDHAAVDHALESVDLAAAADQPVTLLSGGQQQRVSIARAFASEPELLILDEPIAGIDAGSQRRFRDSLVHLIRDHGAGVLLVSHELSAVADRIDRVVVLKRTVVFDGPPSKLIEEGVSLGVHREDLPLWLEGLR